MSIGWPFSGSNLSGQTRGEADPMLNACVQVHPAADLCARSPGLPQLRVFHPASFHRCIAANPRVCIWESHSILEIFWFTVLLAVLAAIAAWRPGAGRSVGPLVATGLFYFQFAPVPGGDRRGGGRNLLLHPQSPGRRATDAQAPADSRAMAPANGPERYSCWPRLAWGFLVLNSIRRWTVARGMPQIHSELSFLDHARGRRLWLNPVP